MELEFLEIEFHAKKILVFKEPYSDVLKHYNSVFLQKKFLSVIVPWQVEGAL